LIQSISLQNFQSHKKSILEFHKGINVITGPSNNGKSSVLRALYWTIYNRPSGDSYISHWNRDKNDKPIKSTKVTIINDNGTIERRKGFIKADDKQKAFNGYIVNDNYLEAIGQDVPDEVTKLFNIDNVNIQKQMDAPFLLSESAGEVARFFNQTIRLDLIDKILAKAESKRREANKDKSRLENEQVQIEKEILEYSWLEDAEILADKIEIIENRINEKWEVLQELSKDISDYKQYDFMIDGCEVILSAAPIVNKIVLMQESLEQKIEKCERLQNLHDDWIEQNTIITGTADFTLIDNLIEKIDDFRREIFDKVKVFEALQESVEEYNRIENDIKDYVDDIEKLEKQLPLTCPVCNQLLKGDKCNGKN
jgi:exonuclease SbcC